MSRAERLSERFDTIKATLTELYGRERAFGAASAAWLMAIQYLSKQALLRLERELGARRRPDVVGVLENEMEAILQSFHAEICEHLGIDQADAWRLTKAFKQVIDDVCHQGG